MTDFIRIDHLAVDCVVGVYRRERDTPQPLLVSVELRVDTERAGRTERLSDTVDYTTVAKSIEFLLTSCRFRLLETAAHALATTLLAPPPPGDRRPSVASVVLTLEKPHALSGIGRPSIRIERDASWVKIGHEEKPFGTVDVLFETKDAGVYRLNVAPGREIPLHRHDVMQESELVMGNGLLLNGQKVPRLSVRRWGRGETHAYANPTDRSQSILCVDMPPFIEADEIQVRPGDERDGQPT